MKLSWALVARPALAVLLLGLLAPHLSQLWSSLTGTVLTPGGARKWLPPGYALAAGRFHVPLLGDTLDFLSPLDAMADRAARFGNASSIRFLGSREPVYLIHGAEAHRSFAALAVPGPISPSSPLPRWLLARLRGGHATLPDAPAGDGAAARGLAHERRTNAELAAGAHDPRTLTRYLAEVSSVLEARVRAWAAQPPQLPIPARAALREAAAEVAARIVLGLDHAAARQSAPQLVGWVAASLAGAQAPPLSGLTRWRGARADARLHALALDRLRAHLNHSLPDDRPYAHALGLLAKRLSPSLLRAGLQHDTEAGVAAEAAAMITALVALVGDAAAGLLGALGARADVAARVRAEVLCADDVGDRTAPITHAALARLPYCRRVVDEARRLTPHVAAVAGVARRGFDVPSLARHGRVVHIPANATVIASLWSAPDVPFDPERSARGEPASAGSGWAWAPHGGAPPSSGGCPGTELTSTILLSLLVQLARDGCSWELLPPPRGRASADPLHPSGQSAAVFTPAAAVTITGVRCAAYPRMVAGDELRASLGGGGGGSGSGSGTSGPREGAAVVPGPLPHPAHSPHQESPLAASPYAPEQLAATCPHAAGRTRGVCPWGFYTPASLTCLARTRLAAD